MPTIRIYTADAVCTSGLVKKTPDRPLEFNKVQVRLTATRIFVRMVKKLKKLKNLPQKLTPLVSLVKIRYNCRRRPNQHNMAVKSV